VQDPATELTAGWRQQYRKEGNKWISHVRAHHFGMYSAREMPRDQFHHRKGLPEFSFSNTVTSPIRGIDPDFQIANAARCPSLPMAASQVVPQAAQSFH
jgi:hypothetical protein